MVGWQTTKKLCNTIAAAVFTLHARQNARLRAQSDSAASLHARVLNVNVAALQLDRTRRASERAIVRPRARCETSRRD